MAHDSVLTLDSDNFDEQIAFAEQPILVDFWADWCAPCMAVAPVLEALAVELEGRARVGKVDVDANGDLANRFGIRSIPTLMVFKGAKVVDQLVGAAPRDQIVRMLERHMA